MASTEFPEMPSARVRKDPAFRHFGKEAYERMRAEAMEIRAQSPNMSVDTLVDNQRKLSSPSDNKKAIDLLKGGDLACFRHRYVEGGGFELSCLVHSKQTFRHGSW